PNTPAAACSSSVAAVSRGEARHAQRSAVAAVPGTRASMPGRVASAIRSSWMRYREAAISGTASSGAASGDRVSFPLRGPLVPGAPRRRHRFTASLRSSRPRGPSAGRGRTLRLLAPLPASPARAARAEHAFDRAEEHAAAGAARAARSGGRRGLATDRIPGRGPALLGAAGARTPDSAGLGPARIGGGSGPPGPVPGGGPWPARAVRPPPRGPAGARPDLGGAPRRGGAGAPGPVPARSNPHRGGCPPGTASAQVETAGPARGRGGGAPEPTWHSSSGRQDPRPGRPTGYDLHEHRSPAETAVRVVRRRRSRRRNRREEGRGRIGGKAPESTLPAGGDFSGARSPVHAGKSPGRASEPRGGIAPGLRKRAGTGAGQGVQEP